LKQLNERAMKMISAKRFTFIKECFIIEFTLNLLS
jgi:hypothetical protein